MVGPSIVPSEVEWHLTLVNAERFWTATFSASTEYTAGGSSENKRLFSLELANDSLPACVDADLRISGHSHQDNTSDNNEPIFSVPVSCGGHSLQPGPGNAINARLDNGPMGHHWVNEFVIAVSLITSILIDNMFSSSQAFVDPDETFHAQLNVKLTQPKPMPPAPPVSPDLPDACSQVSSVIGSAATSSSHSDSPCPTTSKSRGGRKANDSDKSIYTVLRRGGR